MSKLKEMTIDEIKEKYKNRWVLVEVLKEDELQRPVKVRFITHSKTRDEIYEALKEHTGHTYHFYTGKIPKEGYVVAFYGQNPFDHESNCFGCHYEPIHC